MAKKEYTLYSYIDDEGTPAISRSKQRANNSNHHGWAKMEPRCCNERMEPIPFHNPINLTEEGWILICNKCGHFIQFVEGELRRGETHAKGL